MSGPPPFYCPYCGEEDIRPDGETPGRYRCGACGRVFELRAGRGDRVGPPAVG